MLGADVQHHLQHYAFAGFPQQPELVGHDQDIIDQYASHHALHGAVVRPCRRQDVIFLRQPIARVHDPVGQLAVIGKEQQALGIAVETTHGIDALPDVDQVHDRPTVTLIAGSSDVPRRFIEHDRSGSLLMEGTAVDPDIRGVRVNLGAKLRDHVTVDGDPALANHRFGGATGWATTSRHHTLQSFQAGSSGGHAAPRTREQLNLKKGSLGDLPVADEEYHAADLITGAAFRAKPQRELDGIPCHWNHQV